jgi:alpha-L-rhamnosidase
MKLSPSHSCLIVLAALGLLLPQGAVAGDAVVVTNLRCDYRTNPLGIDDAQPRLGWTLASDRRGVSQSAYEIQVRASDRNGRRAGRDLWRSGRIDSAQSQYVVYEGQPLGSGQRAWWRVRVWDEADQRSRWSDWAFWEMGLLAPEDWTAQWIEPDLEEDYTISNPAPMLRREFELEKKVARARAYVTAHGLYEAEINGQRVGDQLFTPGWTAYDERLQYQTYDVTSLLQKGTNALGVTLGDGWYRGYLGWGDKKGVYGERLALLLQLHVVYSDGSQEIVRTDGQWKAATGPILTSDIYMGETYDARLEKPGWSRPGYDASGWTGVRIVDWSKTILVAPEGPPVRRTEELVPQAVLTTPGGDTVFDMGQNMVGWVRLAVEGEAGTTVTLRHFEVLDKDGNVYTANLRRATQTVAYTLDGNGLEVFEPHFTFQGFRYVAVSGLPGEPSPEQLTGVVIHSDFAPAGTFTSSEPLLNQLQENIQWGQKGNFLDVPTDCPQRDERLGWTGDAQAFAPTACFNADVSGFFAKWLKDLAADQQSSGAVPHVIPNVLSRGKDSGDSASAGWADAAVVVPWVHYLSYGDPRILENQYPSMKAWVDYQKRQSGERYIWDEDYTFGDWLAFNTTRSDYPGATTDKDLVATAYFAHSTDLLSRAARVLGRNEDAASYQQLFERIREAFAAEFVTANGRLASNTQTAYALALAFDLLPEASRAEAARRLALDVRTFGHITTGFLGTPLICPVLSDHGYWDEAFMLLNRKEYPSWLYPVTQGATTIWERWDGQKPDGTFQDVGMNSFNHYAYGAIGEWLYTRVAGIRIDERHPGYAHVIIAPHPGGGLTEARATHLSPYGEVASGWTVTGGTMRLEVAVPPNTTATVHLPEATAGTVTEGGLPAGEAPGVRTLAQGEGETVVEVGSGRYAFSWPLGS